MFAQTNGIDGVFWQFWRYIVDPAINILLLVATLLFFYGLVTYLTKSDNAAEQAKGRKLMVYGIIGFAIMVASKQIVTMVCDFFDPGNCQIGG